MIKTMQQQLNNTTPTKITPWRSCMVFILLLLKHDCSRRFVDNYIDNYIHRGSYSMMRPDCCHIQGPQLAPDLKSGPPPGWQAYRQPLYCQAGP
jgi:hypothetical protein